MYKPCILFEKISKAIPKLTEGQIRIRSSKRIKKV